MKYSSDSFLIYFVVSLWLCYSFLITSTLSSEQNQTSHQSYYHYNLDDNSNPYSVQQKILDTNFNDDNNRNNKFPSPSQSQSFPSTISIEKEWETFPIQKKPNHRAIMTAEGKEPLANDSSRLLAIGSHLQPIALMNSGQSIVQHPENIEFQQTLLPHYDCDAMIQDYRFVIESPNYPTEYPPNRICSYYIGRNRTDICQIEFTISDMDIEDTAQCTDDYLDFGTSIVGENIDRNSQRFCGLMMRNTRRIVNFPSNSSNIRITFRSDGKNDRSHRGFSAEVQQIPCNNSSVPSLPSFKGGIPIATIPTQPFYPLPFSPQGPVYQQYPYQYPRYPSGPINPNYSYIIPPQSVVYPQFPPTMPLPPRPPPIQQQPIDTPLGPDYPPSQSSIPLNPPIYSNNPNIYGNRIYPPSYPPFYQTPNQNNFIYNNSYGPYNNTVMRPGYNFGPGIAYDPNRMNNYTPIYLNSYCDIYLSDYRGEIKSPNYPFGYPANESCIYTIRKVNENVCQVELILRQIDIHTPNVKKDLTDNCYGDYLQMPDGSRLCGYYIQSMSGTYELKKYYSFPITSDFMFMHFVSDANQKPDGTGFSIEVIQIPNSCASNFDQRNLKCDQVITGLQTNTKRVYSPNYPNFYGPRMQCVFLVQPANSKICEFELDLIDFNLEPPQKLGADDGCQKDFVEMPDRRRICGRQKFRRIYQFPIYHDRTSMFYFRSDETIEDKGFEILVRQIPDSCSQVYTQNGNQQTWTKNIYVPNDPNVSQFLPPTPVFTYDNSSGLQPYQPGLKPSISYPQNPILINRYPSGYGGVKTDVSSSRWNNRIPMPNVVNDPRNVDSSGTIPLFYQNGTLATRIPPLKPVDMIPFLTKDRRFSKKGIVAKFQSEPNDFRSLETESDQEIYQSSARLKEEPRFFDTAADNVVPIFNCDQILMRETEYIRSPNFPNDYPILTRCIYSIYKANIKICKIRLHILTLDLEYSRSCRNDYLQIESTGEKLCGILNKPETKVINFYGLSRDIRLIFNSDRKTTKKGFEIKIEQIPNSCDDLEDDYKLNLSNNVNRIEKLELRSDDSPEVALLNNTFDSKTNEIINETLSMALTSEQVCQSTSQKEAYLQSENFPLEYSNNIDCLYLIFRSNINVCRLLIDFDQFNVGDERKFIENFQIDSNRTNQSVGECLNDFLEIDNIRYCGNRSRQQVAINFPQNFNQISFYFHTINAKRFNGFRIKVKQIDENCRSFSFDHRFDHNLEESLDFAPAIYESCPKLLSSNNSSIVGNFNDLHLNVEENLKISDRLIKIQSPKFGLSSEMQYEPFLDCHYVIEKAKQNVCLLQIRFENFFLEESLDCTKDYLRIDNYLRTCGRIPPNTIENLEFRNNQFFLHFHTDSDLNEKGFAIIVKQIEC
ncbi:zinc finger protein [Sarcoptes scabiei]|nr:zinc finger protein [Sarcoptes scabiei]